MCFILLWSSLNDFGKMICTVSLMCHQNNHFEALEAVVSHLTSGVVYVLILEDSF